MTHQNLEAWKEAIRFTIKIYELTKTFPKDELYGLVSQMRRSAVSIPSNIAEGCARQTRKEAIQFLYIALGSMAEIETQLIIANELGYISSFDKIFSLLVKIRKLVIGLVKFNKISDK